MWATEARRNSRILFLSLFAAILTDPDLPLARAWDLGDCNNTAVFLLIGKDRKVKYVKKGPIRGAEVDGIVQWITDLIQ